MVKIVRDGMELELTEQEVFDCYRAWRTKQDYERLRAAVDKNLTLVAIFKAATHLTADGLIYLVLKELDEYYRRDEWKDPEEVMFDIIMEAVLK